MWEINGIGCGALICYEYRFPELHREYKRHGVQVVFHSFHAAHATPEQVAAWKAPSSRPRPDRVGTQTDHGTYPPEKIAFFMRTPGVVPAQGRRAGPRHR